MNIVVVIQARLGSTRLPGKVLKTAGGRTLLETMVERVRSARTAFLPVIATTSLPEDEPIRELCTKLHIDCYSGHPTDLLDRHYQCALERSADSVVKIPSDCPLIDPDVIDLVLSEYMRHADDVDFVSNLHPATFPDGNDVEVVRFDALERAWKEAVRGYEREHTTPYVWDHPGLFRSRNVLMPGGRDYSTTHRWVLDYEEDYRLICEIIHHIPPAARGTFGIREILGILDNHPEIAHINARFREVNWYKNHVHEFNTSVHPGRVA